jgi:hypothetical protein
VVGDRDEVHPPPLGELVDLLGRGRALGKAERSLDPEPRELGEAVEWQCISTREVIGAFLSLSVQVTLRFAPEQEKGVTIR